MSKAEKYLNVIEAFKGTLAANLPAGIHLTNISALLKKEFDFFWVGFYLASETDELVIGPYQGEVPCFYIKHGKGVCGTAAKTGKSQIVGDVHSFPGYIACHPEPQSEIVIPGMKEGKCLFVLDVDHIEKNYFDEVDEQMLSQICELIVNREIVSK